MSEIIDLLLIITAKMGYWGIFILMTIESSFIPFPSEIVVPPAAYLAQKGEMNLWLVIISGVLGSLTGAIINYYIAISLGRTIIYNLARTKVARMLLIDQETIKKAEDYFLRFGNLSTFICRLIPGVRQLISLPAGFAKMKFSNFIFYTLLGSTVWVAILALLGYYFGENEEILKRYYHEIWQAGIVLAFIFTLYIIYKLLANKKGR